MVKKNIDCPKGENPFGPSVSKDLLFEFTNTFLKLYRIHIRKLGILAIKGHLLTIFYAINQFTQELLSVEEKCWLKHLSMAGIILLYSYTDHIVLGPLWKNRLKRSSHLGLMNHINEMVLINKISLKWTIWVIKVNIHLNTIIWHF